MGGAARAAPKLRSSPDSSVSRRASEYLVGVLALISVVRVQFC